MKSEYKSLALAKYTYEVFFQGWDEEIDQSVSKNMLGLTKRPSQT